MKPIYILLVALLILGAAVALNPLPSDSIKTHAPVAGIVLQNVDRESAYAIDAMLQELSVAVAWKIPDFGPKSSESRAATQGDEGLPKGLLNFSQAKTENLTSIGSLEGNFTVLNGTMAWF